MNAKVIVAIVMALGLLVGGLVYFSGRGKEVSVVKTSPTPSPTTSVTPTATPTPSPAPTVAPTLAPTVAPTPIPTAARKFSIGGQVTNSSGQPIQGAVIMVMLPDQQYCSGTIGPGTPSYVMSIMTLADGSYNSGPTLSSGNYKLQVQANTYARQWWREKGTCLDADPLSVTGNRLSIDFVLRKP